MAGALQFAGLDEVQQDFVVGHQDAARLIDDGRVAQLLVGVLGGQDRHGGLVDRRPAHAGVEVAGDVGRGGGAADAAAADGGADRRVVAAVVLRDHGAGEVQGGAGDVRVDIDAAGEDDHAGGVDGAAALDLRDDAAVRDADVADLAVDAVGGVVNPPVCDPQH